MTPVVYLHGFASGPSSSKARAFRSALDRAGIEVAVPDLAAGDFEHLTISGQLRVIEETAAGRPVSLVGSSMGGYLAALYASKHPEVHRLVLMAPGFRFAERWPQIQGEAAMEAWRRTGYMEVFHYGENRPARLSHAIIDDCRLFRNEPNFTQPALIFHGLHDDVVPADYSRTFADTHPNVQLELLDSGHDLLNVLDHIVERSIPFLTL